MLTSSNLAIWHFGTLAQRLDVSNWHDIILGRMLLQAFGDSLVIAGLVWVAALASARYVALLGAAERRIL
jgi:ABC-type spermidine/putrescine transport system permease subunit I